MNIDKIIKTRCYRLAQTPEQIDQVKTKIAQFKGVESVEFKQDKLLISYDLMKCQYVNLKSFITEHISLKPESAINKLISSLISFTEQNELDHAQTPCGWSYYVHKLYLSVHKGHDY